MGPAWPRFYETLEIVDCVISDNVFRRRQHGAALRGRGCSWPTGFSTRITGTTIANNKADGAGEYNATRGGGIAGINDGTDVYITDCTIENNESDTFGGGIYMLWSKLYVTGTTIEGNEAASGGGVYGYYASLTIADSLIADNDATNGAGMMVSTGGRVEPDRSDGVGQYGHGLRRRDVYLQHVAGPDRTGPLHDHRQHGWPRRRNLRGQQRLRAAGQYDRGGQYGHVELSGCAGDL